MLGVFDILGVIVIMLAAYLPLDWITWVAMIIIMKGLIFAMMRNFVSFIDIACGLYIILLAHGIHHWIPTLGTVLFLGQKGAFSLL